jgi:hypothetical protein
MELCAKKSSTLKVGMLLLCGLVSCNSPTFKRTGPLGGQGVSGTIPPVQVPSPKVADVIVKSEPVPLEIKIVQLRPEAWFKNCVSVAIGNETQFTLLGCNKDINAIGKTIKLNAKSNACNTLKFQFKVYKNADACDPKATCVSKYAEKEDWLRATSRKEDSKYFKVFDAQKLNPLDPFIHLDSAMKELIPLVEKEAVKYAKGGSNQWIRIFFEDQSDANVEQGMKQTNPAQHEDFGLDFNDFIFDIRGENLKLGVENSPMKCE